MRADSVHVRHAIVEVNVVIGVLAVLRELLVVVRVVPVFLDCDAAAVSHFVLIALHRSHCFHRRISVAIFLYLEVYSLHALSVTVNCC